jgi:hypothetical protein
LIVEARATDAVFADLPPIGGDQVIRKGRTFSSKVDVVLTDQDLVYARVAPNVIGVCLPVRTRMKGISLLPRRRGTVAKIDVVAAALLSAARAIRLFASNLGSAA